MSGTLEHLDPTTLLIGENVRDKAGLEPQFVASIGEHGVLQPVTAVRTETGVEVRDGQRRTLAAREAGLTSIPVYVLDTAKTNIQVGHGGADRPADRRQRPPRSTHRRSTGQAASTRCCWPVSRPRGWPRRCR